MKCPYAVNRQTITETVIEYDDEGNQTGYTEITNNNAAFINCLGEECGAYKNGECCYKG